MDRVQELSTQDDIAAIATPLVPAAIAVIRTSGTGSIERVARVFSRPNELLAAAGNTLLHGWVCDRGGQKVDEVVVAVWRSPKSFTGEDAVEIFCHGGVAVVRAVYDLLLEAGFRQANRGEFTLRSFLSGKADLTQAEATAEIIAGKTRSEALKAASRLTGELSRRVVHVRQLVVDCLGTIEVAVEYPEDEAGIAGCVDIAPLTEARALLRELASSWKAERLYQDGVRVIFCGKSNAGKSSLFNALLKEDRAIVSSTAGTTRDWLEAWADFAGLPVLLFDTAGLREAAEQVEAEGVARTRELAVSADAIVYVVDMTSGVDSGDIQYMKDTRERGTPVVLAANKCDIAEGDATLPTDASGAWDECARVSAKTGVGLETLVAKVKQLVLGEEAAEREAVGLGSERQRRCVVDALAALDHAIDTARGGELGADAVVEDLEECLSCLAEITGETTTDDILDNIFSRFCVGK